MKQGLCYNKIIPSSTAVFELDGNPFKVPLIDVSICAAGQQPGPMLLCYSRLPQPICAVSQPSWLIQLKAIMVECLPWDWKIIGSNPWSVSIQDEKSNPYPSVASLLDVQFFEVLGWEVKLPTDFQVKL